MRLPWSELAKLYAPFLVLAGINIVGFIYALGYRNGQQLLLNAAASSAKEITNG